MWRTCFEGGTVFLPCLSVMSPTKVNHVETRVTCQPSCKLFACFKMNNSDPDASLCVPLEKVLRVASGKKNEINKRKTLLGDFVVLFATKPT